MHSYYKITGVYLISAITISSDGYVRLTFDVLQQVPLTHLISGLDEEDNSSFESETIITGYTEWISSTSPAISIGWDWMFNYSQKNGIYYKKMDSEPRSNIMLIDTQQCDIGHAKTAEQLELLIEKLAWQIVVQNYISEQYA